MRDSSEYNTLFNWQVWTRTKDTTLGEMTETFQDGGDLWGSIDHNAGLRLQSLGQSGVVLVVRNYPTIKPGDVLIHKKYGVRYAVDNVYHGDHELNVRATAVT